MRRTAATNLAKAGHPPHVVAAILNHTPGRTQGITAIYVIGRSPAVHVNVDRVTAIGDVGENHGT